MTTKTKAGYPSFPKYLRPFGHSNKRTIKGN